MQVVAERHLGITVNHDFALVEQQRLCEMMGDAAREGDPQGVVTYCTNLRAAPLARRAEAEYGFSLLDTVSTTVWGMLRSLEVDTRGIRGWGRLFEFA